MSINDTPLPSDRIGFLSTLAARLAMLLMLAAHAWVATASPMRLDLSFYRMQKFSKEDGLPTDSLLRVDRMADGTVLVQGISGPPVRFDGFRFQSVACAGADVAAARTAMAVADGSIWLATPAGLYRCADGRAMTVPTVDATARIYGLYASSDRATVWVGSQGRLCKVAIHAPHAAQCHELTRRILDLREAPDGRVFLGTPEGLLVLRDGKIRPFEDPALAAALIWAIHVEANGRVLVGTRGLGLAVIEGERVRLLGRAQGLKNDIVRGIAESQGAIWLATAGGGVFRWEGDTFSALTVLDGLSSNTVTAVAADEQGVLWATTAGGGLNRIWPSAFAPLVSPVQSAVADQAALTGFSYGIHRDRRGRLWIGGNQGLLQWTRPNLRAMGSPGPAQHGAVMGIVDDHDALLVATRRGLARFSPEGAPGSQFQLLTGDQYLRGLRLAPALDGGVWLGTDGQILKYHAGTLVPVVDLPTATHLVNHLLEDTDLGLLIATTKGAFRWQANQLTPFGTSPGMRSRFWRDGDRLYIAGDQTEVYAHGRFTTLKFGKERTSLSTINMFPDSLGGMWFGTREGLYRAALEEVRAASSETAIPVRAFGLRDGIPTSEFEGAPQAVLRDGDEILLTSTGGVIRIQPKVLGQVPHSLVLRITEVQNEQTSFAPEPDLRLPAGTRRVSLRFAALPAAFNANADISYRLLPIESEFRSDDQRREAVYGALQPQKYTLELRAHYLGQDAAKSQSLRYDFAIAPHWYERTGFKVGASAAIFALALGLTLLHIIRLRAQRHRLLGEVAHQNRELERLARTDGLTSLANRRSFDQALAAAMKDASLSKDLALVLMDIDYFKRYNDSLGHQAGDQALREVAAIIEQATPDKATALAARIGGEEFAVLVRKNARKTVAAIAQDIQERLRRRALPHPDSDFPWVTLSMGVAMEDGTGTADALVRRADVALYRAKDAGRNRAEWDEVANVPS